jgi:hypothetical protein
MVFMPQEQADHEPGDGASATSATGRWVRRGHAIELLLDGASTSAGFHVDELEAPAAGGFTAREVIDARIDPCAQSALLRMRDAGGDALADAGGLLRAVKSGALAGIYGANLQASVKLARNHGTVWWELLPAGQDAALVTDPMEPYGPPTIVFRAIQTPGAQRCLAANRLDPALRGAWRSFLLVEAGSAVQCDLLPETAWTEAELGGPTVIANVIPPVCMQPNVPSSSPVTTTPKPSPGKPVARDELTSWCHPFSTSPLIGQIHFPTNSTILSADDKAALERLARAFNDLAHISLLFPVEIEFHGYADYRSTTYPGGNIRLAEDRALSCHKYFMANVTASAKRNVDAKVIGEGIDPRLVTALPKLGTRREPILKRMRRTAILRKDHDPRDPEPIISPRPPIPPKDCPAARKRGRDILNSWRGMFTADETRHLTQICDDRAVRDGFLNGMDSDFIKTVYGIGGTMTDAQAEAFANRFHVCTELMHPFATGPNADELEVVGALKGLHSRIEMAIDHLVITDALSGVNQPRTKLSAFVLREMKNPASIYYRWL